MAAVMTGMREGEVFGLKWGIHPLGWSYTYTAILWRLPPTRRQQANLEQLFLEKIEIMVAKW
jgi:hypothetical protein